MNSHCICGLFVKSFYKGGGTHAHNIWHLRKKVEVDPENPRYIHNERGFGYRFQVDG